MDVYNSHLKKIINANNENRLAVFVGSGISLSSNSDSVKLPLWGDLIQSMKVELDLDGENDYLKVAQLYFLEFGESIYYSKIKSFFPDSIPPSEIHKLIFELMPQCVITTNWDSILEDAIDESGALYSVISSDKDLVKATNLKKLIKMHGDFKSHNIVFKEDDYLNYTHNFPLIESYIKSILSTHTIIFIGYSYNDINLKHIMKWIQNHSDYSPPMYLMASRYNVSQTQYLMSHGIKTLVLKDIVDGQRNNSRFDKMSYMSQQVGLFLECIKTGHFTVVEELTPIETVEAIFNKIKHLEGFDFILLKQIVSTFTNCGFVYAGDQMSFLELYVDNVLTMDYDKNTRQLHEKFISILTSEDDSENTCPKVIDVIEQIMKILAKANILGIIVPNSESRTKKYFVNEYVKDLECRKSEELIELNFSETNIHDLQSKNINQLSKVAKSYSNKFEYHSAYQVVLEIILLCKKTKNYAQLLIALFNINTLILKLKYSSEYINDERFKFLNVYDLQEQFLQFPQTEIKKQQTLYDFLSLKTVYIQTFKNSDAFIKIKSSIETVKKGGYTYNNEADKPSVEHANLLFFAVKNNLIINDYIFNQMMKRFVDISIVRQSHKIDIDLNVYELYTCIKYIEPKELTSVLSIFKKGDEHKLVLSDTNLNWLIDDVLHNILQQHLEASSVEKLLERELQNVIMLISYVNINENSTEKVLNEFSRLISSTNNTISTYESINDFFAVQHKLFDNKINEDLLIELIEGIINKVVYRNAHGWDNFAITKNKTVNIYEYVAVIKGVYKNVKLIGKLIIELNELDIKNKVIYVETLLHSIYQIGNDDVKKVIKKFIDSVIAECLPSSYKYYQFILWCAAVGFIDKVEHDMVVQLEEYIRKFEDGKTFHSNFYSLKEVIGYLVNEKNINSLQRTHEMLMNIINMYESRRNLSII